MTSLLLCIAVAAPHAHATDPADDVAYHVDQARLFFKKGWATDAARELDSALSLPGGDASFDAHRLAAEVWYALLDVTGAVGHLRAAEALAPDPGTAAELNAWATSLTTRFGVLVVTAPYDGVAARLDLAIEAPPVDPEHQRFLAQAAAAASEKQPLPRRLDLPVGTYTVNGLPAVVRGGTETAVVLPLDRAGTGAALQVTRLEVGLGAGLLLAEAVDNLRPSLEVQIGVSQPLGRLVVGVQADWALRSFATTEGDAATDARAWGLGARLGVDLLATGPLGLRPSLGYRYGWLPGLALDCVPDGQGGRICQPAAASPEPAELFVYGVGRQHTPFVELAADVRRTLGTRATGLGLKLVGETSLVSLADPGRARLDGGSAEIEYAVDGGPLVVPGGRVMATFTVGL